MPEAVTVPCLLILLALLLPPCMTYPGELVTGVDLISRTPTHLEEYREVVQQRLQALVRRLVKVEQDSCREQGLLIVFLQLYRTAAPNVEDDDQILSLAIDAFTGGQLTPQMVLRSETQVDVGDISSSINRLVGNDAYCVVWVLLLPDLDITGNALQTVAQSFPLALKLILLARGAPEACCPGARELSTASALLSALWWTERALRATTIWYRCVTDQNASLIGVFDPFTGEDESASAGQFYTLTSLNHPLPLDLRRFGRRMNLRRTALTIYGFEAAMAYRRQDIDMMPRTFPALRPGSSNESADALLDALFGADVEAVRELAARMNFSPTVHHARASFGFKMANGTFTGVLGRLVQRDTWLSMNVYFLKDYETREVQFSAGVYQDSLCVFVQAAGMLPDWLLIFRCFTPTLWIIVWSTVVVVSVCYLALARLIANYRPDLSSARLKQDQPQQQDPCALVGQIVGALLTAPTNGFNRTSAHQKLFVAFGLIWGLTMTGAFQGSLVDVYTTPTSMRNLDTLSELDASGLTITVTAPALIVDVFGTERPGSTLGNLKQRLVLATITPNRTGVRDVLTGDTAGLIRNQDFVRLSTKYLSRDGTPRLYRMRQCPRSYTLAYLYPRGSPLYRAANDHILHFLQHGLYAKWQRDAEHIVRTNRALKVHRLSASVQPQGHDSGQVTLRLNHLLVPFMLLGAGLALGVACFVWERTRLCRPDICV